MCSIEATGLGYAQFGKLFQLSIIHDARALIIRLFSISAVEWCRNYLVLLPNSRTFQVSGFLQFVRVYDMYIYI